MRKKFPLQNRLNVQTNECGARILFFYGNNRLQYWWCHQTCICCSCWHFMTIFPLIIVFPLHKMKFECFEVKVPAAPTFLALVCGKTNIWLFFFCSSALSFYFLSIFELSNSSPIWPNAIQRKLQNCPE